MDIPSSAATELGVVDLDTSVNDVDIDARTSGGVIDVAGAAWGTVGDTAQAVGGSSLGGKSGGANNLVLLDIVDLLNLVCTSDA